MQKQYKLLEVNSIKLLLLPALFIYILLVFLTPRFGFEYDLLCWSNWVIQLKQNGFVSAYDNASEINYLPLYLYVLKCFGYFFTSDQVYANIHKLKAITLLFDIGSILLICSLIKSESNRLRFFIFGVLNIGYLYNTIIWNQVDGILSFFIFSAFYLAYFRKTFFSILLFTLALNLKLQGIIFVPILLAIWWPELNIKKLFVFGFAVLLLQSIIILPFLIHSNAKNIVKVIFGSVDHFQLLSLNAYNIWHIFIRGELRIMPDNVPFIFGFTYKSIGLLLFCLFSLFICIPLYLNYYKERLLKEFKGVDLKLLLISMALICYFFFFFNTQMHERYIHPVIVFLTALAFIYRQWIIWLIVSINYAYSLEYICNFMRIEKSEFSDYYSVWMAWVYALGLILLLYQWYKALPPKAFSFKRIELR